MTPSEPPAEDALDRQALIDAALVLAEEAEPHLTGPDQAVWLDRLEAELPRLVAAADAAVIEPDGVEAALRLVGALARFFWMRGHSAAGRKIADAALARDGGRPAVRAKALSGAGALAYAQSDFGAARALHERALAVWMSLGDAAGIARSHDALGMIAREQGDIAEARELHAMALGGYRAAGDHWGMANTLSNLGVVARLAGDLDEAQARHREALTLRRELGDALGTASSLANLGVVARLTGRLDEARALLEECLSIRRGLGDRWGVAGALGSLGVVARTAGDLDGARTHHEQALALCRELGDGLGMAEAMEGLAAVAGARGETALAESWIEAAREQRDRIGAGAAPEGGSLEARVAEVLAAVLAPLAPGATIPPSERFAELQLALERFVPDLLGGRAESLDGLRFCVGRKLGHDGAELVGVALSLADQTWTPLWLRIRLSEQGVGVGAIDCMERFHDTHIAQALAYLKATGLPLALLINCNVPVLKRGLKRVVMNRPRVREDATSIAALRVKKP